MRQLSFLHTSDLHLDAPFSSIGDEAKAHIRQNEVESTLHKICERVQEERLDLLLISGDLFEDKYVKGSTILKVRNIFSELYNTEIIIVPGNHDPVYDNSYYKTTPWGSNVHILEDTKQILFLEKLNTCIYCLGVKQDIKKDYDQLLNMELVQDRFNILVFHGTVDLPFEEENYNSITSKELFSLGMDYIALGHMHCYSEIKNGRTVIVNPGSPEPLGFDEEGEHGFAQGIMTLQESKAKQTVVRFISSAGRHYHNLEINISDCASDSSVIKKISEELKLKKTDLYKILTTGFISRDYSPDLGYITDGLKDMCFFVKLQNRTSVRFDYEDYLEDPGIKGEFVRKILDMRQTESSQEKLYTLELAMQYGLQALENERVDG